MYGTHKNPSNPRIPEEKLQPEYDDGDDDAKFTYNHF